MGQRKTKRPLRRGPRFESLESRNLMSGVPSVAAAGAFMMRVVETGLHASAAEVHALARADVHKSVAPTAHRAVGVAIPAVVASNGGKAGVPTTGGETGTAAGGAKNGIQIPTGQAKNDFVSTNIYTNYIGGTLGLQAFVDGLYIDLLGRNADTPGETYYLNRLQDGAETPYQVVQDFLSSPEYARDHGGQAARLTPANGNTYTDYLGGPIGVKAFVDGLYYDVLNQVPDPAGEAHWVGVIEAHPGYRPAYVTDVFIQAAKIEKIPFLKS